MHRGRARIQIVIVVIVLLAALLPPAQSTAEGIGSASVPDHGWIRADRVGDQPLQNPAHGAQDGHLFTVIKKGVPPEMVMAAYEEQLSDTDIWNIVNYIRTLAKK